METLIKGQTDRASGSKAVVNKERVSAALRELADEHRGIPRSDTARLREVLDDVEDALSAGRQSQRRARHASQSGLLPDALQLPEQDLG